MQSGQKLPDKRGTLTKRELVTFKVQDTSPRMIGTLVNGQWLPIKTTNEIFLLNKDTQERLLLASFNGEEYRPEYGPESDYDFIIELSQNVMVCMAAVNDTVFIRKATIVQMPDSRFTVKFEPPKTLIGLYDGYDVSPDKRWLLVSMSRQADISDWPDDYQDIGNDLLQNEENLQAVRHHLIDLTQPELSTLLLSRSAHLLPPKNANDFRSKCIQYVKQEASFITSKHLLISTNLPDVAQSRVISIESIENAIRENTIDINLLDRGVLPLPQVGAEKACYFASVSPNGEWLSVDHLTEIGIYQRSNGIFIASSTIKAKGSVLHKATWLVDNTLIFKANTYEGSYAVTQYRPKTQSQHMIRYCSGQHSHAYVSDHEVMQLVCSKKTRVCSLDSWQVCPDALSQANLPLKVAVMKLIESSTPLQGSLLSIVADYLELPIAETAFDMALAKAAIFTHEGEIKPEYRNEKAALLTTLGSVAHETLRQFPLVGRLFINPSEREIKKRHANIPKLYSSVTAGDTSAATKIIATPYIDMLGYTRQQCPALFSMTASMHVPSESSTASRKRKAPG